MAKRRGMTLIFLSLLMAVGAAYVANEWVIARVMPDKAAEQDRQQVVAAAMTIPFATKVDERHLRLVDLPEGAAPEGFFTSIDEVAGKVSTTEIPRGEILIAQRFREHSAGSTLAALVDREMRAVTVRVDDVVGVAGFLLPGNRVDVLASRKQTNKRAETETILRNIKVLAVDQTASADSNEPVIVRAVTLEMAPRQAEELFRARTEGTIQLTLRNPLAQEEEVAPPPKPQVVAKRAPRPRTPPPTEVMVIRGTSVDKTKTRD
ncbi:MAG: Flp pilus assembly protein CpaB [Woeseiaceae bacterium]|nr:Flp pilus assembly protein CpaB [Woeseiaceae bacterium]NIP20784.1 Flp pilus assembly protein CpaB [Woeseiaceae bacterium]NIS89577.1 Flp pilus assembly protein CpaB [Woeseiaceae bacterium]